MPGDILEGIEKNVLPFYEKLIHEHEYWDKLKIIRYIEENLYILPRFAIVFCDEAQDFCRVELRFILHLSELINYNLSEIDQVPVVFAGDPNQTVNPTGFRVAEMRDMLYKELKEIAGFDFKPDKSEHDPSYNYRSSQSIVSLANFVQFYRKKTLGMRLLKPQEAKRPEPVDGLNTNIFINYDFIEKGNSSKEKLRYKVFIVPIDVQDKEDYIKENPFFSSLKETDIKTSVEAKGAEYQQVVLYGFGDYYIRQFQHLSYEKDSDKYEHFKKRYFFNKLYVGITRAQKELIIIDSKESETKFWRPLIENKPQGSNNWQILDSLKEKTIIYNPDSLNSIITSTPAIALENAQQDKERGIYDRNAARLKVAANQFYKLGYKDEYYICLALSEELKGNWKEAGFLYMHKNLRNEKLEEAASCFFKGKLFTDLLEKIGNQLKNNNQDVRIIISRLMNRDKLMRTNVEYLYIHRHILSKITKSLNWRNELIERIIENTNENRELLQNKEFADILEAIAKEKDVSLWHLIGDIHFELHYYERAIDDWDKIDYIDHRNYVLAKIEVARKKYDFVDEIIWLGELLKYEKLETEIKRIEESIVLIFNENKNKPINEKSKNFYYLYALRAFLLQRPHDDIEILGIKAEQACNDNLYILLEFYNDLLMSKRLKTKIAEYITERWAKVYWKIKQIEMPTEAAWLDELNADYQKFAELYVINFEAYSPKELEEISEYPEPILWNPPPHLKNIKIQHFRRFDELTLNNIGQFNLIVGDNNIGKTSFLEALLFTHNKEEYFIRLAYAYSERINLPRMFDNQNKEIFQIPRNYFKDFIQKETLNPKFQFTLRDKRAMWHYDLRSLSSAELIDKFPQQLGIDANDYFGFSEQNNLNIVDIPLILKNLSPKDIIHNPLIPFGKGFGTDLAQAYYDEIDRIKSIRNQFLNNMKIFIPNIERISVDTESGEISIEETNFEEAAPLHQYGEGANKLFRILVQLTLQKGKRLLIDEIDSGIHFSHFNLFWKVILKAAQKNNTQVFATTHNLECIKNFKNILQEEEYKLFQNKSRVITLRELPNHKIKSYIRTYEEFEYELDNDFEIRGGSL